MYICSTKKYRVNPFLVTTYISSKYFCNRILETNILKGNALNQIHTCLFSQRRIGKTGLIKHAFNTLFEQNNIKCLYADISATQNQTEFTKVLSNEIFHIFPEKKNIGKKFLEAIKSFRPVVSYDSLSGIPELSLEIGDTKSKEKSIQEIFRFLDNQDIPLVIAIDEFQQITEYPEKNTEALLRSIMQEMRNITFIFCGSNMRLMSDMFNHSKRPFYASCQNLTLGKIDSKDYSEFIHRHFEDAKKYITAESITFILDWTCGHTYYTQYVCNQVFALGKSKIELINTQMVCKDILLQTQGVFLQYKKLLTADQWSLITAIAKEKKVTQPYANGFISKYRLKSSANVKRSLDSLLEKEMIYSETNHEETFFEVYDKFLMRWLQMYG